MAATNGARLRIRRRPHAAAALVFDAEGQPTTRTGPAAPASDLSSLYDGSFWTVVEDKIAGRADDVTIAQASATPEMFSAWHRGDQRHQRFSTAVRERLFHARVERPDLKCVLFDGAITKVHTDATTAKRGWRLPQWALTRGLGDQIEGGGRWPSSAKRLSKSVTPGCTLSLSLSSGTVPAGREQPTPPT